MDAEQVEGTHESAITWHSSPCLCLQASLDDVKGGGAEGSSGASHRTHEQLSSRQEQREGNCARDREGQEGRVGQ